MLPNPSPLLIMFGLKGDGTNKSISTAKSSVQTFQLEISLGGGLACRYPPSSVLGRKGVVQTKKNTEQTGPNVEKPRTNVSAQNSNWGAGHMNLPSHAVCINLSFTPTSVMNNAP